MGVIPRLSVGHRHQSVDDVIQVPSSHEQKDRRRRSSLRRRWCQSLALESCWRRCDVIPRAVPGREMTTEVSRKNRRNKTSFSPRLTANQCCLGRLLGSMLTTKSPCTFEAFTNWLWTKLWVMRRWRIRRSSTFPVSARYSCSDSALASDDNASFEIDFDRVVPNDVDKQSERRGGRSPECHLNSHRSIFDEMDAIIQVARQVETEKGSPIGVFGGCNTVAHRRVSPAGLQKLKVYLRVLAIGSRVRTDL